MQIFKNRLVLCSIFSTTFTVSNFRYADKIIDWFYFFPETSYLNFIPDLDFINALYYKQLDNHTHDSGVADYTLQPGAYPYLLESQLWSMWYRLAYPTLRHLYRFEAVFEQLNYKRAMVLKYVNIPLISSCTTLTVRNTYVLNKTTIFITTPLSIAKARRLWGFTLQFCTTFCLIIHSDAITCTAGARFSKSSKLCWYHQSTIETIFHRMLEILRKPWAICL